MCVCFSNLFFERNQLNKELNSLKQHSRTLYQRHFKLHVCSLLAYSETNATLPHFTQLQAYSNGNSCTVNLCTQDITCMWHMHPLHINRYELPIFCNVYGNLVPFIRPTDFNKHFSNDIHYFHCVLLSSTNIFLIIFIIFTVFTSSHTYIHTSFIKWIVIRIFYNAFWHWTVIK